MRAPWRIAVFGTAIVAAGFVVVTIGALVGSAVPIIEWARAARIPLDHVYTLVATVLATWATARLVSDDGFRVWEYVGLGRGTYGAATLGIATLAGILVLAVPALVLVATGAARFEPSVATDSPAMVAWAAVALLVPAAFAEELIFRGYLFSACADGLGARGAVAVTSVLFSLAHIFNPDPSATSIAAVTCAGIFLGVVRYATGSLMAATLAHFWVNFTQAVVLHAPVSGLALQTPGYRYVETGPDWLTGGAWGPEGGAGTIVALALASFLYLRRSRGTRTSTPAATP